MFNMKYLIKNFIFQNFRKFISVIVSKLCEVNTLLGVFFRNMMESSFLEILFMQ